MVSGARSERMGLDEALGSVTAGDTPMVRRARLHGTVPPAPSAPGPHWPDFEAKVEALVELQNDFTNAAALVVAGEQDRAEAQQLVRRFSAVLSEVAGLAGEFAGDLDVAADRAAISISVSMSRVSVFEAERTINASFGALVQDGQAIVAEVLELANEAHLANLEILQEAADSN